MQVHSFSQDVTVPVPDCALAPELAANRAELLLSDCVFRLVKESRESIERRSAPVRLIECRARLRLRQPVAAEETRCFELSEKERRLFDDTESLFRAHAPERCRRKTASRNQHVRVCGQERQQATEERDDPIRIINQMQIVNDNQKRLALLLKQLIDESLREHWDIFERG